MTDDPETVWKLTQEMVKKDGEQRFELVLKPDSLFHLVGVVQLAKRHPNLPPVSRLMANLLIEGARRYFHDCPTILEVIRRGDDPSQDVH